MHATCDPAKSNANKNKKQHGYYPIRSVGRLEDFKTQGPKREIEQVFQKPAPGISNHRIHYYKITMPCYYYYRRRTNDNNNVRLLLLMLLLFIILASTTITNAFLIPPVVHPNHLPNQQKQQQCRLPPPPAVLALHQSVPRRRTFGAMVESFLLFPQIANGFSSSSSTEPTTSTTTSTSSTETSKKVRENDGCKVALVGSDCQNFPVLTARGSLA